MAKNSFLLVSLKEDKAKELAQVISNPSCRQILDYLADNDDTTETDLSKKLNIPISTVHYNMKHLVAAKLVTADEFHYSEKGKEVNHYKLANKYIIIAPKTTYGIKEKLKSILPISLLALAGAATIQLFTRPAMFGAMKASNDLAVPMLQAADEAAKEFVEEAAVRTAAEIAPAAPIQAIQSAPNYALWFLFGSIFVIILVIIFELIKSRKK